MEESSFPMTENLTASQRPGRLIFLHPVVKDFPRSLSIKLGFGQLIIGLLTIIVGVALMFAFAYVGTFGEEWLGGLLFTLAGIAGLYSGKKDTSMCRIKTFLIFSVVSMVLCIILLCLCIWALVNNLFSSLIFMLLAVCEICFSGASVYICLKVIRKLRQYKAADSTYHSPPQLDITDKAVELDEERNTESESDE